MNALNLKRQLVALAAALMLVSVTGCVAVKVVDTAASAAIGVTKVATKVAVKGVSTAVQVVTPNNKKKKNPAK